MLKNSHLLIVVARGKQTDTQYGDLKCILFPCKKKVF
jgi:hypothetical protein